MEAVFPVKKVTTSKEINDNFNEFCDNEVMFFIYNTLAYKTHEPKGLPMIYVLQVDDEEEIRKYLEKTKEYFCINDKKKRSRVTYSPIELSILQEHFTEILKKGPYMYLEVVKKLNRFRPDSSKLSVQHIKNWVSNQKQKLNRQKLYTS